MLSVYTRIFLKLFFFIFSLLFILFFVVYGYRYNKNIWFIQQNVFFNMNFWSDETSIKIWEDEYSPRNKKVSLYNLDIWCYSIDYDWKLYKRCFGNNQSWDESFVKFSWKTKLDEFWLMKNCYDFKIVYHDNNCIDDKCFSDKIINSFTIKDIWFVHLSWSLLYCNSEFDGCKYLTDVSWETLCYNNKWIISYERDGYYLYGLK